MSTPARTLVSAALVAPPMLAALVAEPLAWAMLLVRPPLPGGAWYGDADLLVAVHLLTVCTLGLSILGAGWQLVPVIVARAPGPAWGRVAAASNGLALGGALPFVLGLGRPGKAALLGAGAVVLALLLRSGAVTLSLLRGGGRPAHRAWLLGAELCLLMGLGIGLHLLLGRAGLVRVSAPMDRVGLHAALLLGGWVGGSIVGFGSLLLPMFAVAPEPRPVLLGALALPWFGGIALRVPALWAAGALGVALLLGVSLLRRRRPTLGAPLRSAGFALVGLGLVALGAGLRGLDPRLLLSAFALAALPMLRGVALRIGPFFTWSQVFAHDPLRAPEVGSLVPGGLAAASVAGALLGGLLLVSGVGLEAGALCRIGAAVGLLGALLHAVVVGVVLRRALRHPSANLEVA